MPLFHHLFALACAATSGLALATGASTTATAADDLTRPIRGETPSGAPIWFLGTNSCSANACHNRGNALGAARISFYEPRPYWEHIYWRRYDPHAGAFAVLRNEQSKRIERNLRKLATSEEASPERDGLCLSCHVHQNFSNAAHGPEFALTDGVGCESCHGASERWSAAHVRAGWDSLSDEQKASYGFVPLDSLADRARSCTPCHVGSTYVDPEHGLVDVNHDLIAAGHPRLNFEFASYHAQYPKHWSDVEERRSDPSYEARAWIVGQLATAEAALELLAARAGRSVEGDDGLPRPLPTTGGDRPHLGPWPEFAEYNCYACHHDLRGGVPLGVGTTAAVPGELPWGTWATPMSVAIAREFPPPEGDWSAILGSLTGEMTQPAPDVATVLGRTEDAVGSLDSWIASMRDRRIDAAQVEGLMEAVIDHLRRVEDPTWDRNAQAYLALAALYSAQADLDPSGRDPALGRALEAMLARLEFRDDANGPPSYRIEAPADIFTTIGERTSN